jgi:hypothetical protein
VTVDSAVSPISAPRGAQDNTAACCYLTRTNGQDTLLVKLYPYRYTDPPFFITRASVEVPTIFRNCLDRLADLICSYGQINSANDERP